MHLDDARRPGKGVVRFPGLYITDRRSTVPIRTHKRGNIEKRNPHPCCSHRSVLCVSGCCPTDDERDDEKNSGSSINVQAVAMSIVDENSLDNSAHLIADEEQIRQALAEDDADLPSSSDWTMNTLPGPFRSVSPVLGNWSNGVQNDSAHCLAAASTRELTLHSRTKAALGCAAATALGCPP